jgi:nucleoside-diphosphate-sugar epimerase
MSSIFITGSSGFVGLNLIEYLRSFFTFIKYQRETAIEINQDIVIHLAGKAHDLKKTKHSDDYYQVNTELTKTVFDAFLASNAKVFITLSSVKAIADNVCGALTEEHIPNPSTHYGKSKLLAEQYILSKDIPLGKRVYVLRPCMIHGAGNKGNLNLIYKLVSKGIPWPLGAFDNKRSFCSIDNLMFIMKELIENTEIASGIYNIADDEPIGTNKIIEIISNSLNRDPRIWRLPQFILNNIAKAGDILRLPLNTERLNKLTETYIVSNKKIKSAINKSLPVSSKAGLLKTIESFNH